MKVSEIPKAFLPPSRFYLKFPIEILLGGGGGWHPPPPHTPGRDAPVLSVKAKALMSKENPVNRGSNASWKVEKPWTNQSLMAEDFAAKLYCFEKS